MAKDPFQVLELSRSASKAEVKSKYREMAKLYHPDSPNGDTKRMEEINRAYNLLLKEGAYERFHLKPGARESAARQRTSAPRPFGGSSSANTSAADDDADLDGQFTTNPAGPSGIYGERRHPRPFADESAASPLEDAMFAKLVGLDASTERVTPEGKYMYQNTDTGEYVTLDKPLLKAKQTRYGVHEEVKESARKLREQYEKQQMSSRALWEELSKKSADTEKREEAKTWIDRLMVRFEESGSLVTRNKAVFVIVCLVFLYRFYCDYMDSRPSKHRGEQRASFYGAKGIERQVIEEQYMANAENFNTATAAAAIIFLSAASKKSLDDPVVGSEMDEYNYSLPRRFNRVISTS